MLVPMARRALWSLVLAIAPACGGGDDGQVVEGRCQVEGEAPDYLQTLTCRADFDALASAPIDPSLPGARSIKLVLDRVDAGALYLQHSTRFERHYEFISTHLSGGALPVVPDLATFNATEYASPDRRFVLAALTFVEGPARWVVELAPYDGATPALIEELFAQVVPATYVGPVLAFHPTSDALEAVAAALPPSIPVVTTDELYAGIRFQPLALGTGIGRLTFLTAEQLAQSYVSYQALVVLDEAPNDLSVVQGVITEAFQTPLSHVNVLARNWGVPNMGLRGATSDPALRALDGKLVELTVAAAGYAVREVTLAEAEAFWAATAPSPVELPPIDLTVTALTPIADVTPVPAQPSGLRDAIKGAIGAFGGKAAHYAVLTRTAGVPIKDAFVVPIAHYAQFMADGGFAARVAAFRNDPAFVADPAVRDAQLARLRADLIATPLPVALESAIQAEVAMRFPGAPKIRFRTSSNSEDLDGFPCAGCYDSHTGTVADPVDFAAAIKATWATVWTLRAYELRQYYQVAHDAVGMALLVHPNFEAEEANGVAVTANPFDPSGTEPAQYVNVQLGGDVEVVAPPPGVTSDQFLYYVDYPGQPLSYLARSNLIPAGETVLSLAQVRTLGEALAAVHAAFAPAYGGAGFYGMDVEFKFDDEASPGTPALFLKQARPYPDPFASTEEE